MGDKLPRRRDVLRSGVAAGLVWFGWTGHGLAQDETTTARGETATAQSQRGRYAFSYSLQRGDRFEVRFQPRDSAGDPVTKTISGDCLDGQSEEHRLFIVRVFRANIDLGYRDLFVPQQAAATESPETSPETETSPEETTPEAATPEETTPETETTTEETTTEAALQDATTVNETTPADEATTVVETTPLDEETTPTGETTPTEETTTTGTTPAEGRALPEIRRGEWYRVTSSVRCADLHRLTLATAERPETTPGVSETTTGE